MEYHSVRKDTQNPASPGQEEWRMFGQGEQYYFDTIHISKIKD